MTIEKRVIDEFPTYDVYSDGIIKNQLGHHVGYINGQYLYANLKNRERVLKKCRVHRIVYTAFHGEIPKGYEIDHINGDCMDNRVENLQALSKLEHRKKTHRENPYQNAKSAPKRSKKVIGIDPYKQTHEFESISSILRTFEMNPKSQSRIIEAIRNKKLLNGWTFEFLQSDQENTEWFKVPNIDQEIYVNKNGYIKTKRVVTRGSIKDSYYKFNVKINGKIVTKGVHELVCMTFHGAKPEWATSVNHIDEDKLNNKPENLEWSNSINQINHTLSHRVVLQNEATKELIEFISLTKASEFLNISDRRRIQTGLKNGTSVNGYKVISINTKNRNCRKRKDDTDYKNQIAKERQDWLSKKENKNIVSDEVLKRMKNIKL